MSDVTTYDALIGEPPDKAGKVRSTVVRSKETNRLLWIGPNSQHYCLA